MQNLLARRAQNSLSHFFTSIPGTILSITNFASSVSRNMERLSLDTDHRHRQEETRRHRPEGLSEGLKQGLTGFGLSVLGELSQEYSQILYS